jgi:hypothetical protein
VPHNVLAEWATLQRTKMDAIFGALRQGASFNQKSISGKHKRTSAAAVPKPLAETVVPDKVGSPDVAIQKKRRKKRKSARADTFNDATSGPQAHQRARALTVDAEQAQMLHAEQVLLHAFGLVDFQ